MANRLVELCIIAAVRIGGTSLEPAWGSELMYRVGGASERSSGIRLGHELPFWLASLKVVPATRQVERNGVHETVEPRVMQVLVALARKRGEVVSRDTLIDQCWDGRIVGENAINRIIARLRALAQGLARDCFTIETITKIGYRLIPGADRGEAARQSTGEDDQAGSRRAWPNRRMAIAATVAAAAATGALIRFGAGSRKPNDAAAELIRRGQDAMRGLRRDDAIQAVAYLSQATRADSGAAEAWGGYALALALLATQSGDNAQSGIAARAKAAASRALALDDNADARLALAMGQPLFRNWLGYVSGLQAVLAGAPHHPIANTLLAESFTQVGRFRDAARICARVLERDPLMESTRTIYALALWGAQDFDRAEQVIAENLRLWPGYWPAWMTALRFLATTGRADAAVGLVEGGFPTGSGPIPDEIAEAFARAMAGRSGWTADRVQALIVRGREQGTVASFAAAFMLGALHRPQQALALLRLYYSPGGQLSAIGAQRETSVLFVPAMASLRPLRDYSEMLRLLGLEDYWRQSGSQPDFRRLG